ncbi:MAG: hypothetical protein WB691_00825, partial [Pseudolabrys sp.]
PARGALRMFNVYRGENGCRLVHGYTPLAYRRECYWSLSHRRLAATLATTGIIIIFVVFILLQRQDLRNRLVRIAGSHDLQRTTLAMDDAGDV